MSLAVAAAHEFVQSRLKSGGRALDATAGCGHDTAFLARLLGPAGEVHACDIQSEALLATRRRWEALEGPKAPLHLHDCGHECVLESLEQAGVTTLDALMFNLGYLPGGDPSLVTRAVTTLTALQSLGPRLAPRGILTVVAYPRHPGGRHERDCVLAWSATLSPSTWECHHLRPLNLGPDRPELITIVHHASR